MGLRLVIKLKDVLRERGLTQQQLAEMSGVRRPSISEFATNARTTINKEHLLAIAKALNIRDIRELIDIVDDEKG
ncbi:predicted transcriptional regulator [Pelotomaculum thermopropionicum SI]|uniref:Predicted transcriptional regulator n=1 Tax=Pelotomaculum thermopropionicum (strain DSM 13744 / JCM 10971 / SI) TaxID=370438 RepID=A5D0A5_PELTS|nr:predicted transcriptional regulator [Pelotomaculum thermopropionicum SI]